MRQGSGRQVERVPGPHLQGLYGWVSQAPRPFARACCRTRNSEALDELQLKRYCCRRMVLTHVDLIEKLLKYNRQSVLSRPPHLVLILYSQPKSVIGTRIP
jgi:hypothetical protein